MKFPITPKNFIFLLLGIVKFFLKVSYQNIQKGHNSSFKYY